MIIDSIDDCPRQAEDTPENSEDSNNVLLPPTTSRGPGAPKKRRVCTYATEIDQDAEPISKRLFRCGRCGGVGHSRRTCNEVIRNWYFKWRLLLFDVGSVDSVDCVGSVVSRVLSTNY